MFEWVIGMAETCREKQVRDLARDDSGPLTKPAPTKK